MERKVYTRQGLWGGGGGTFILDKDWGGEGLHKNWGGGEVYSITRAAGVGVGALHQTKTGGLMGNGGSNMLIQVRQGELCKENTRIYIYTQFGGTTNASLRYQ